VSGTGPGVRSEGPFHEASGRAALAGEGSMTAATDGGSRRLLIALQLLTFTTGLVDAASVLGLGHVFTANMTGNVVFLGFALGGTPGVSIAGSLVALAFFLVGAGLGGLIARRGERQAVGTALALELGLLVVAAGAAALIDGRGAMASGAVLVLVSAPMGIQNAAVRRLGVPDMPTTVLTLTLTGIAADSSLAGGTNPRLGRRLGAVFSMLAGALLGALLMKRGLAWTIGAAGISHAAGLAGFWAETRPRAG